MKLWKYTPHVPTASKHVYYTFIVSWVELSMVFGKFSDLPFLSVFVVYLCCVPPYNTINLCYCICISVSLCVGVCVGECLYDVYTSYNTVSIYNKRKLFETLLKSSFRDCIYSFLLGWSPIAHFGAGTSLPNFHDFVEKYKIMLILCSRGYEFESHKNVYNKMFNNYIEQKPPKFIFSLEIILFHNHGKNNRCWMSTFE